MYTLFPKPAPDGRRRHAFDGGCTSGWMQYLYRALYVILGPHHEPAEMLQAPLRWGTPYLLPVGILARWPARHRP